MSIFGERIRRPGPDVGTILSDYAKKDYVDSQDALRVLKSGDTMTGDLDMGGGSWCVGCPKTYGITKVMRLLRGTRSRKRCASL